MKKPSLYKKGSGSPMDTGWAQVFFFILMVIGFIIALSIKNPTVIYIIIFISGLLAGRMIFEREEKLSFPYYLILIGYLVGFLLGVRYGDRRIIIVLYVLGGLVSYYLYEKGFLHDISF